MQDTPEINEFQDIIASEAYFLEETDGFTSAEAYEEDLELACEITEGQLFLELFDSEKIENAYRFWVTINQKNIDFELKIHRDSLDQVGFLAAINLFLTETGYRGDKKFYNLAGKIAKFGVGFMDVSTHEKLVKNGFIAGK
jgi:hypothetical protein